MCVFVHAGVCVCFQGSGQRCVLGGDYECVCVGGLLCVFVRVQVKQAILAVVGI